MKLEQLLNDLQATVKIHSNVMKTWTESEGIVNDFEYDISIRIEGQTMRVERLPEENANRTNRTCFRKTRLLAQIITEEEVTNLWEAAHTALIERLNKRVPCKCYFTTRKGEPKIEFELTEKLEMVIPPKPESFNL